MKMNDLLEMSENLRKSLDLRPLGSNSGPMGSESKVFANDSLSVRLSIDRGEPVIEINYRPEHSTEWFDANIVQNCILEEDNMPVHTIQEQFSFLSSSNVVFDKSTMVFKINKLKEWERKRAKEIFGLD